MWIKGFVLLAPVDPYTPDYPPRLHNLTDDPEDIRAYRSTKDILHSGRFTPDQRAEEYRRRQKGPAGVIDGEYNDAYLEDGVYNDEDRDWDADA